MKVLGTVESDRFEHKIVQPHFINPCCFGEDLANWLREQLGGLSIQGFEIDEPLQEDYGWGFWLRKGRSKFWLALSYVGVGPTEAPAQWVVSVTHSGILAFLIPQREGTDAVYAWETKRYPNEPWITFVNRCVAASKTAVEKWPDPDTVPPDLPGRILYNLAWVSEEYESSNRAV